MSESTQRSAVTDRTSGDGDGVRAAIEDAGLTCAEFGILALEDLDMDDTNFHALVETWSALQPH